MEGIDSQLFLQKVCNKMAVGQLLCTESFSLFDSMTAIEIGDPKMDIGLLLDLSKHSADALLASGKAPIINFTPQQLVSILDALLRAEASWYNTGAMLPLTIYSSLYVLKPERLLSSHSTTARCLYAYCMALRCTAALVYDLIINGAVVDEEDMSIHPFDISLDPTLAPYQQKIIVDIDDCLTAIRKDKNLSQAEKEAIVARLKWRRSLVHIFQTSSPNMQLLLQRNKETAIESHTVLDQISDSHCEDGSIEHMFPSAGRAFMGAAPPRPSDLVPFGKALEYHAQMLNDLMNVYSSLQEIHHNWWDLKSMLLHFGADDKQPIIRSIMHLLLVAPVKGSQPTSSTPKWCISQRTVSAAVGLPLYEDDLPTSGDVHMFLEQCTIAYQGWVYAMCTNRCRQRRRQRRLIEDWRNMVDHAWNADACPVFRAWCCSPKNDAGYNVSWYDAGFDAPMKDILQGPLTSFMVVEAALCGALHLMLGFPLELYQVREYSMIYMYCEYFYGWAESGYEHLSIMEPIAFRRPQTGKQVSVEALKAKVEKTMCEGEWRLVAIFMKLNLIPESPLPFNTVQERFEQRFSVFQQLSLPGYFPFEEYLKKASPEGVAIEEALDKVQEIFIVAQKGASALAGLLKNAREVAHYRAVSKVALQSMLAAKVLLKSGANSNYKVSLDFSLLLKDGIHSFYPVVGIKRS